MLASLYGAARAAVAEGADQRPVRVPPGGSAPGAAIRRHRDQANTPAATAPTAPGAAGAPAGGTVIGEKEFNSCKKYPSGKRIVKLNLKPDTELGDLIAWISSITCKQFLLPGTIPANSKKVTIVAPELITPEEAYRLFLGALDSVGLTVQPSGHVLRIIETVKAKSAPIPLYGEDSDVPTNESYVTRLIRVENADPNEVAQVLGRLKGEQGDVIVYAPQGALIVTDLASNIQRMMAILKQIDQPGSGEKVWIIGVKNTSATDMAQKLGEIFQVAKLGGKGGASTSAPPPPGGVRPKPGDLTTEMMISKIIPDERSNQLIVIANEKSYARLLTLVKKLDVPIDGGDGRIHVYYCENANCDELAQTIGSVTGIPVSGTTGSRTRPRSGTSTPTPTPTPGATGQPLSGANMLFEGEVRLNFDRPTNSLIVVSSLKDYQSLRRVIELLDSPRKQVFVEAMILEVTLDKQRDLGASWHGVLPEHLFGLSNPSLIVGGLNPANTLQPTNALGDTMLAGILGPVLDPATAAGLGTAATSTVDIPSFGVLIKALQTNSDVDVLSNPHILIMNNEDGEISVGQKIPFPVSTLGINPGGGATGVPGFGLGNLFPQVQRENVALEIKLTPHVNEHDIIRMEVDAKDSELGPTSPTLGPSTSERSAKTVVVAKDQQTILIGGLMSDKIVNSVTKIPLLGDIPILGFFFRNTSKHIVKTNLIIALTPYVINDQSDLRRVLEKKMKERREFVERFGGEDRPVEASIDYRRKIGMLEEINKAAREVEKEELDMQRIREKDLQDESGPVDLPVGPGPGFLPPGPPPGPPGAAPPAAPAAPPAGPAPRVP
ncbi:MAG TPA: type II secretion system secretin GspD [Polyangia bacterium]|nr:type II secretion system secretin GspD [Polyangia bacterium]